MDIWLKTGCSVRYGDPTRSGRPKKLMASGPATKISEALKLAYSNMSGEWQAPPPSVENAAAFDKAAEERDAKHPGQQLGF